MSDRARLNALCRKNIGKDVDNSWIKYIERICDKTIKMISNGEDETPLKKIETIFTNTAQIFYMIEEYEMADNFFLQLRSVLNDYDGVSETGIEELDFLKKEIEDIDMIFRYLLKKDNEHVIADIEYEKYYQFDYAYPIFKLGFEIAKSIKGGKKREFRYVDDASFECLELNNKCILYYNNNIML